MNKETRRSAIILAILFLVVLAISVSTGAAREQQPSSVDDNMVASYSSEFSQVDSAGDRKFELEEATATFVQSRDRDETGTYIVVLKDPPLASYRGGIDGLTATNPQVQGIDKFDAESDATKAYSSYLERQQEAVIIEAEVAFGRPLVVSYQYKATLNGFAAEMSATEAARIEKMDEVLFVEPEKTSYTTTDAGPQWINADDVWAGLAGLPDTKGEGIIVGVIDTGVDPWNPSFAATGDDGFTHTNPFGAGVFKGVCDSSNTSPPPGEVAYDSTFPCNDKLIGVYGYTASDTNPRDTDGHGSHTSSTAAGNLVMSTTITTTTAIYTATISGVAPHANLIVYDGCSDAGGCPGAALNAARDQALLDGVDVINYSIGSPAPTSNPWSDSESLQWLALRDAGVFVATSAGNNGNGAATIGSPGDIPWITTVGANSHDRAFLNSIELDNGVNAPITIDGFSMTGGYGPKPVVLSKNFGSMGDDERLCAPGVFPSGTFNGEIVVCERGSYGRVAKGQSVKDGGAGGFILAQPDPETGGPGSVATDPHVLPAVHIDYQSYQDLLDYLALQGTSDGTIAGSIQDVDPAYGDILATFSSRGPNRSNPDILVPSVTAPGRAIWAAYHQGSGGDGTYTFNVIQGTSMASPHVAGAGALMKALHPGWSPAEIQSALMTTARTTVLNDDGVSPTTATVFDIGSGHIDLAKAGLAGLVLNVTTQEYEDADPSLGGDPKDLNLASLGNGQCVGICSWTRTVKSTLSSSETWEISTSSGDGLIISTDPVSFTIPAGSSQQFIVTVDASGAGTGEWAFGEVIMTPGGGNGPLSESAEINGVTIPDVRLPVAVVPSSGNLPTLLTIETRRDTGSRLIEDLEAIEITDLTVNTFGLTEGTKQLLNLSQDATRDNPYDNLNDETTQYFNVTVPSGAMRLVAETFDSEAPDMDLFVGTGTTPSAATEVCASTTGTAIEYCNISNPAAGTWWILVQNWAESGSPPDELTLSYGVVSGDAGNMSVVGPASNPAQQPFDLRVFWDEEDMKAGDRWYGKFNAGSDAGNPGNIGSTDVNLIRQEDDIAKRADPYAGLPGEVLTYTITVQPNITPEELNYTLTDTIPAGLTYITGSVTATTGIANVVGNTLTWTGTMSLPESTYNVETSVTDPSGCIAPLANSGAYVDLEGYGLATDPAISGDTIWFTINFAGGEFNFFGENQGEIINFTDDGFAFFDPSSPGSEPWAHKPIPTVDDPNNLMAIFWRDMEVVYDMPSNSGVTLANLTSGGVPSAGVIEYDNVQDWPANGGPTYDFEVIAYYEADPGRYEVIFAYDNLGGSVITGTIGLEDKTGLEGVQYAHDDIAVTDGMAVCFDLVAAGFDPVEITYAVTVDEGSLGVYRNDVLSITDNPGDKEAETYADVIVGLPTYFPAINKQ